MGEMVNVGEADEVAVTPAGDPVGTAVLFRVEGKLEGATLAPDLVGQLAGQLGDRALELAQDHPSAAAAINELVGKVINRAGRQAQDGVTLPESVIATPIMAQAMSVSPGRIPREALVAFRVGGLTLTFAISAVAVAQAASVITLTKREGGPKGH